MTSAKARFLTKLEQQRPSTGACNNKGEADIAAFRQSMAQLQELMSGWLEGTEIRIDVSTVSLVELLLGGKSIALLQIALHYGNSSVKFSPAFLYGQGVVGCVEVTLQRDGKMCSCSRLFMRSGEVVHWTWSPADNASVRRAFDEDAFFQLIEGILP